MDSDTPLVSVIIPAYNCERYLAEAISSVLAQTYRPIEILVVDDGSTDGTADVAHRFENTVEYHRQPHRGPGAARNAGIDLSQGDYIAFLDADDLWEEDKLTLQMASFDESPALDVVFGHVEHFYSPELEADAALQMHSPSDPLPGYYASAMLVKRDVFQRVGPFDENLRVGEFVDWYSRAMDADLVSLMLQDILVRRRIHGGNLTIRERGSHTDYLRVVKASIDRQHSGKGGRQGHAKGSS
jgi:glycosyltransferase involved in cell wall biosynthesis